MGRNWLGGSEGHNEKIKNVERMGHSCILQGSVYLAGWIRLNVYVPHIVYIPM